MLQWTGGSRRKVASARKSTHSRQKQYFEQRKRRRQGSGQEYYANGQEYYANGSDMDVLYNNEPRSLDILNLINLAAASQQASTKHNASESCDDAKAPADSLLGKSGSYSTVTEEPRVAQVMKSPVSNLPQDFKAESYECADYMNKWKVPGSLTDDASGCLFAVSNEKKERPQIEVTVLDLLEDRPFFNGKLVPEAHVALLAEGLGKIRSQTPAHSPRMQNRFSCMGIPMSSDPPKLVLSSSAVPSSRYCLDDESNVMINDFKVSPLSNKDGSWASVGTKTTIHKSNATPLPLYSQEVQLEDISIKKNGLDACFLSPNDKYPNDKYDYVGSQHFQKSIDTTLPDQRFSLEEYPFLNPNPKMFKTSETSDMEIRDIFHGSSRNLWEGEKFQASAGSTPHFRCSTFEDEINPSFVWDSGGANGDEIFDASSWSFLRTENYQDNISLLSRNSNPCSAATNKSGCSFRLNSTKPEKCKTASNEMFQKVSEEGSLLGVRSQDESIFPQFNEIIWGKRQGGNSTFELPGDESILLPGKTFPSKVASTLDPFNSFTTKKSTAFSGYESLTQDDHFDFFPTSKSKFEAPSEREPPSDFLYQPQMFSKHSIFDFDSHVPVKPSSKANSHDQYSYSGSDFRKEMHLTSPNEDRGSSGKPQPKDPVKKSTSSGNAESAAGVESLGNGSDHKESKNDIPEHSSSPRVELSNQKSEALPNMEEFPSQIQNYVQSQLNQFRKGSPLSPHPSNEESKATFEPGTKKSESEGGNNGDASYQVMLQSYVLQLLCVQKVLLEASEKDVKKA